MPDGLKSKTLHGLFWSFFERFGQQGIQFIISIILARMLLPEQFGLIAMLTIFIAIAQSFLDSGFVMQSPHGSPFSVISPSWAVDAGAMADYCHQFFLTDLPKKMQEIPLLCA